MFKRSLIVPVLILVMSLSLGLAGCMRQAALLNPTNLSVGAGQTGQKLSVAQVRQAILLGAKAKGWVARELSPGVISANLSVRNKHQAEVEIPYSADNYSIIYKNSHNLDYDAADNTIHNQYNNWVNYLRLAIDGQMAAMN